MSAEGEFSIPIINIEAWTNDDGSYSDEDRLEVAKKVGAACRDVGFFGITGHGANPKIISDAWESSRKFFDTPLESKVQYKTDNEKEYPYGYENSEVLSAGKKGTNGDAESADPPPPDLKETYSIGPYNPEAGMPPRRDFPSNPPEFGQSLSSYYEEMERLAQKLLRIMAVALDLDDPAFFESRSGHHFSALRVLNYFPVKLSQIQPGQLRASAHTDYGALTILKSGGPGLQVKKDIETDEWVDVPYLQDTFIINLGDMMRQWTNDRWLSTLHRVVVTKEDAERRQSIAYFCNVNGDCMVDPRDLLASGEQDSPKYKPISAKEHLMAKHLASMGIKTKKAP